MKTFSPKPRDIERHWYVIDAQGAVLGRLASEVAKILRGKHKPIFAPHADTGDHVIVVNARGVRLTGAKEQEKVFYRHSGYPGGLRQVNYARLMSERPRLAVERAVRGMLPKNRLGRQMITKLAVYEGPTHPHQAQRPVALELGRLPKWEGLPKPQATAATAPQARQADRKPRRVGGPKATAGASRAARAGGARRTGPAAAGRGRAAADQGRSPQGEAKSSGRRAGSTAKAGKKRATRSTGAKTESAKKPVRSRARKTTKES